MRRSFDNGGFGYNGDSLSCGDFGGGSNDNFSCLGGSAAGGKDHAEDDQQDQGQIQVSFS